MTIKMLFKLTALAAIVAWGLPAHAGKFSDLLVAPSSGTYFIGYPDGAGSLTPARGKDAVLISSGAVLIQSTSATSGHKVLRVRNNAGTEVLSVTQGGALTATLTGNADTATALAANGANCSPGNYPLGVDASGAVEGCTSVGVGDVVLSATQTFTGGNKLYGSTTFYGAVEFAALVDSATALGSITLPGDDSTTDTTCRRCVTGSTLTVTTHGLPIEVIFNAVAGSGSTDQVATNFLLDGAFVSPYSATGTRPGISYSANNSWNASFNVKIPAPVAGVHSFCATWCGGVGNQAKGNFDPQFRVREIPATGN